MCKGSKWKLEKLALPHGGGEGLGRHKGFVQKTRDVMKENIILSLYTQESFWVLDP